MTVAEAQLERAKNDPRLARGDGAHLADYWHALEEARHQRGSSIIALQALARLHTDEPAKQDYSAHAMWERSEYARATETSGYAHLNALTVIALFAALDGFVERLAPAIQSIMASRLMDEAFERVRSENPDAVPADYRRKNPEMMGHLHAAMLHAFREKGGWNLKPVRDAGKKRWEKRLKVVGLSAPPEHPVPDDLNLMLRDVCAFRNLVMHRGGRMDERALKESQTLGTTLQCEIGDFVRLGRDQYALFSSAVCAYGHEVGQRVVERMGVERTSDLRLDDWRAPRWV